VDGEKGNYDYLMFADLDYDHPEVAQDVIDWGVWLSKEVKLKGIRFDAVKHFSEDFLRLFITKMDEIHGTGWFFVGEFWKDSLDDMSKYLERMGRKFSLFDAPLVYNFSTASKTEGADLRKIFDDSLVMIEPINAVVCTLPSPSHSQIYSKTRY
jgi:alpha-amylase